MVKVGGHSITTWTRRVGLGGTLVEEDQWKVHGGRWGHMTKVRKYLKCPFFVHLRGVGIKIALNFGPRSC